MVGIVARGSATSPLYEKGCVSLASNIKPTLEKHLPDVKNFEKLVLAPSTGGDFFEAKAPGERREPDLATRKARLHLADRLENVMNSKGSFNVAPAPIATPETLQKPEQFSPGERTPYPRLHRQFRLWSVL